MKAIGSATVREVLAMAGRRSPWGGGKDEDGERDPAGETEDGARADDGRGENGESGGGGDPAGREGEGSPNRAPGPKNPWLPGPETPPRRSASFEDLFRGRQTRRGGGPRGPFPSLPQRPNGKSWLPLAIGLFAAVWIGLSTVHVVGQKEEGLVTRLGQYSRTVGPGMSLTLPWPIETMDVKDVTSFTVYTIPEGESEKLMLTSDKNLVDLSYLVRWNIKNLKNYSFQLVDPEQTVREVAEASMRASIAQISFKDAVSGAGRGLVEEDVRSRMQRILDYYRSGVSIQGVEVKKADPPTKVGEAFQEVSVAQQGADKDRTDARAWAQQLLASAQADATSFDKVYEQYKLSPEVTKRRMYYETMERLLRKNGSVILESKGVTPYLPLPEVRTNARPATREGDQ